MSQVSNTGTSYTNNNSSSITPWNRTPGKPGISSSGSFSSTHWPSNKPSNIGLNSEQEDSTEQIRQSSTVSSSTQGGNHSGNNNNNASKSSGGALSATSASGAPSGTSGSGTLTVGSALIGSAIPGSYANSKNSDSGQMWPPPIFDSPRLPDPTSQHPESSLTINQWSGAPFSTSNLGAVGSLLGSPSTLNQPSNPWPLGTSTSNCSSVPRAITGQQLNPLNTNVEPITNSSDHTRRFVNWTLGGDQEPLNDDGTGLSLPLSNLNISTNQSTANFTNLSDYVEGHSLGSNPSGNPANSDNLSDFGSSQVLQKKSSIDSDNLLTCDSEEAIRTAVNTTEPWGLHPVDQSTPWNFPETNGDSLGASPSAACVSPSISESTLGARGGSSSAILDAHSPGSQQSLHSRRINSISSAMNRDLESNVWPSEPPNGTGIWESHYESLGERTARWQQQQQQQQSASSSAMNSATISQPSFQPHYMNQPTFAPEQLSHPIVRSRPQSGGQLQSGSDGTPYFRAINRAAPSNVFPMVHPTPNCSAPLNMGARPLIINPHSLTSNLGSNNSRAFPLSGNTGNIGPGGSWPVTNTSETPMPNLNMNNKNRWPNSNMNRLAGKQPQPQQPLTHMLPNQNPNGLRWPPIPPGNPSTAWPVNDQRRPPVGVLPGPWSQAPVGTDPSTTASYFNQPPPPRGSQHGPGSDFSSSIIPPTQRSASFRPPQNSMYPNMNPGLSSSSMSQRMYLSPQQHSIQLQQQSLFRAQLMRQLANLGFTENEVQSVFADASINVERALLDLRDRTGHPGLDDVINSVKGFSGMLLPPSSNMDDGLGMDALRQDLGNSGVGSGRPITTRSNQNSGDPQVPKPPGSLPTENLELSLHLLQQRETQILQAIMQLHSKHQELTQKVNQIRQANVPFATNSMLQELQLQTVQVAHQIDAQQAQLKHVRSQAGLLKQIPVSSTLSNQSMQQQQSHAQALSMPLMQISPSNADLPGSLPWESGPWSGAGPQINDGYQSNGNPLSADRRWSSSGLSGRSTFASSQIPSLGDPRWSDSATEAMNNPPQPANLLLSDTRRSLGEVDDLRSGPSATGGGSDLNQVSGPIASKSWILVHNIPPHISAGMIKLTVSTTLANSSDKCNASTTAASGVGAGGSDVPEFEFHPNMSARWILLGLSNHTDASIVHDCLDGNGSVQPSGYYGSIKMISPNEALLRLQDIQSLASRIKSLGSDVPIRSGCQPNALVDFTGMSADLTGNPHLSSLSITQSTTTSTISEPNTELSS